MSPPAPIAPRAGEEVIDLDGLYVAPGFIDLHIHGALGRDAMEADADGFRNDLPPSRRGRHHRALPDHHRRAARPIARGHRGRARLPASAEPRIPARACSASISRAPIFRRKKGARICRRYLRDPDPAEWRRLLEHADVITQMTLAPELPGALPLIEALAERGIIASVGHSDAWDEEVAAAFAHGLRHATHTYNCMSTSRRRGPYRAAGVLEFVLSEPEILCEAIADGRHISPTLLRLLCRAKGVDGIALITDATAGAGLPAESHFMLGETAMRGAGRRRVNRGRTARSRAAPPA